MNSSRSKAHLLIIAVILGAGAAVSIIYYYQLAKPNSDLTFNDGISGHILSVHAKSNGLASISLYHRSSPTTAPLVAGNFSTQLGETP